MNVDNAVKEMLEYLELSGKAIDAVWGDEVEETKGLYAIWEEHPDVDESDPLTFEDLEAAMQQLSDDFPVPPSSPNLYNDSGYNKVKGLKDTMPVIFSSNPKHMQMCPLDDDVCSSMENAHPWPIADIIIHLNDKHQWARRDVADWLETLDVDLTFEVPEGGEE